MNEKGGVVKRVDVFSAKGGVGKTTVSVLLARAQAAHTKKPVLVIDADLTGTCLGDLLAPLAIWARTENLAHLLCDPPELLDEALAPTRLPVFVTPKANATASGPDRVSKAAAERPEVLFCPSHGASTRPTHVDEKVLQAFAGHETAGGWVGHVIDMVIDATCDLLDESKPRTSWPLGGVIVDHSPGMAALQSATLRDVGAKPNDRRALVVTTSDHVDLKMTSETMGHRYVDLRSVTRFVVNRAPPNWRVPGRVKKTEKWREEEFKKEWLKAAVDLPYQEKLRNAYEGSDPLPDFPEIATLRAEVFE